MKQKVQVWIYFKQPSGTLFVLLLKTLPKNGAIWQPVTGGVDEGEALEVAALREAQEESGFQFKSKPLSLNHVFQFEGERYGKRMKFEETTFALEAPAMTDKVKLDSREHDAFQWIEAEKAESILKFDSNKEGLRRLIKRV